MATGMQGLAAEQQGAARYALADGHLGLQAAQQFRVMSGKCTDCVASRQALWYFENDTLAVPRAGDSASTPLVWLGSPSIVDNARVLPMGTQFQANGQTGALRVAPKIATNLSYWNGDTTKFFGARDVRMRGSVAGDGAFVARTVWPRDYAMTVANGPAQPLRAGSGFAEFVREADGGAKSAYATRLIWERNPGQARNWTDQPVLGVMLNGAQGDDDEAFGGHFGVATGRIDAQGGWSDWIVNNFYNLDSVSEKGIIAAPVPMDNYLMDTNSGQQYYRPSYMLVAVLNNPRTAAAYQSAVQQVFERFYKHEFTYHHSANNCTGISMDVFKTLGWQVPERGPTSTAKAIAAYAYIAAKDGSLTSGRKMYDYLTEEQVRLYPAVAFEVLGNDLLDLLGAGTGAGSGNGNGKAATRQLTEFERQLQSDVQALVLVRIPQIPSSRAMGSAPVFSFDEYRDRTPADQADWKIVPVAPRPFPAALRVAGAAPAKTPSPVPLPVAGVAVGILLAIGALWRWRRARKQAAKSRS